MSCEPSLTAVDTTTLLHQLRNAPAGTLPDVETEIVHRHECLVHAMAYAYITRGIDRADFERLARDALWTAARSYGPEDGDFASYATTVVILEVRQRLGEESRPRAICDHSPCARIHQPDRPVR